VIAYIIAIVVVAFIFDFINGFHDSANSIATIVGTRVLKPLQAVLWAATFNFAAAFFVGTKVASTLADGILDVNIVSPNVVLAGLLGAIFWNLITWYAGLPSSSSHALIGGYAGAGVAKAGMAAIAWGLKWKLTLLFIVLSPLLGFTLGATLMIIVSWTFKRAKPAAANRFFKVAQLASSALFSLSHGANDAQKTMGIIVGLLVSAQAMFAAETGLLRHLHWTDPNGVPHWVEICAYTAISLGTLFGGWRIVHTMGSRVTKLRPVGGFSAETGGAISILIATELSIPVSTTHTITGAIVGVGVTNRTRAVRWGIAGSIVWAWVMTIPAAAFLAAICFFALNFAVAAG
jgi:PiT family inorganic phosphate transporter